MHILCFFCLLTDRFEFDIEHERAVGGYVVAHFLGTVAHVRRDGDGSLAADLHVLEADVLL